MKFSTAIIFTLAASASAFTTHQHKTASSFSTLRMAVEDEGASAPTAEPVVVATPPPKAVMSQALPFMARPAALDGSLVGDVGFDPLGFAKTKSDLLNYREAEIKHGRLAMLAAAGWPLSELFDRKLAAIIGAPAVVDSAERAPSILNGGLDKVSPIYWAACLALASAIEVYGMSQKKNANYTPGNLGFDPLGMYPKDSAGQERMQLAELKNGRLAMIAITAFAFQEFVNQAAVVESTSIFFKPFTTVAHDLANSGYIQH
jgi:hypothetical protein